MKIGKAIVILDHYDDPLRQFTVKETKEAAKLGIEALKRTSQRRENLSWKFEPLLPRETL